MGIDNTAVTEVDGLRRSLGLRTVISTSAGLTFASSTFLVVVQVAHDLVGDAAWIPILIAGLLCCLAAAAFSELNGMYPSAAGISLYIRRAFGVRAALLTSLTYVSVITVVVGTEAYVLSHVLTEAIPAIKPPVWILLMLTVASAANLYNLRVAGRLQDVVTYSVICSIVTMSLIALSHVQFHVPAPLHTGGAMPVFNAVGLAVFLFVGFEWVTPLADEVKQPRSIPIGMFIALALLVTVYSLLSVSMFAYPSLRGPLFGTEAHREAIPHVIFAKAALGDAGRWCMIITSLFMSLTTFNAGLMGVSRLIYSLAQDHALPSRLRQLSARFGTPSAAVLAVYVIALVVSFAVYFTQRYIILVNLAAATESFIYAFAAASVVALRLKESDKVRPYRMWGGLALPILTAIVFTAVGLGVFAAASSEYWGAAVLLVMFIAGWAVYIHLVVMPRRARMEAEAAAKRGSRRPSRRPPTNATPLE
ncbi:MAG: APC family permease [Armatimonadota bacterium]|nr:APC family permease [Armatimonadota bacterium]